MTFDEAKLAANAGLLLVATVAARPGLSAWATATIDRSGWAGRFSPWRKIFTVAHAMVAVASHINDAEMLRVGFTPRCKGSG